MDTATRRENAPGGVHGSAATTVYIGVQSGDGPALQARGSQHRAGRARVGPGGVGRTSVGEAGRDRSRPESDRCADEPGTRGATDPAPSGPRPARGAKVATRGLSKRSGKRTVCGYRVGRHASASVVAKSLSAQPLYHTEAFVLWLRSAASRIIPLRPPCHAAPRLPGPRAELSGTAPRRCPFTTLRTFNVARHDPLQSKLLLSRPFVSVGDWNPHLRE